jgi:molybdate transport system substrate-binding protein
VKTLTLVFALAVSSVAHAQSQPTPRFANAKPDAVRVMATNAVRGPLDATAAEAARVIGRPVALEYGSARGNLKDEILAGEAFDVALLLPDVDAELRAKGKVAPGAWEIARIPVAIGVRGDLPADFDVTTLAGLKRALVGAAAVKYAPAGAARDTSSKVFMTLDVKNSIRDFSATRRIVQPLHPGEYELNVFPQSEIIANPNLRNLGPVMPALQVPVIIEATVSAQARDPQAALALVKFLQSPAIDAALKESGMTRSPDNRAAVVGRSPQVEHSYREHK